MAVSFEITIPSHRTYEERFYINRTSNLSPANFNYTLRSVCFCSSRFLSSALKQCTRVQAKKKQGKVVPLLN
jgi:hypothetical protein